LSGSGVALVRASKACFGGTIPRAECGRVLLAQPLQGLVEPLDLPLGLRVVGLAVLDGDPQGGDLGLEATPAVRRGAAAWNAGVVEVARR